MSTQHTPGPWKLAEVVDGKYIKTNMRRIRSEREGTDHGAVCEVYGIADGTEAHANARLIAVAPLLLTELKKARAYIAEHHTSFVETVTNQHTKLIDDTEDLMAAESGQDLLDGIDGVIAKAEGKQCPT